MRRVVITGTGMVTAAGNDSHSSWETAKSGKSPIRNIQSFDTTDIPVKIAAEVDGLDTSHLFDIKEDRRISKFLRYAIAASDEAIKSAGLDEKGSDLWGCCIGVGLGCMEDIETNTIVLRDKGARRVSPFFIPYTIANMAAGLVSMRYHLRGPNLCTTTACTSGTHGVGEAFLHIRGGMADVMVAGGAESCITPLAISAFASMKALSTQNDSPATASRPFDAHRDGFVMGEGAGILVLEEYEHAKRRGAHIIAEVAGYGVSADAHHMTAPSPNGEGAERCMRSAIRSANISPEEVDYVNAHGTSTQLNDAYESAAIGRLFGDHAKKLPVSSTKGVTGHCLGGAGGIEAVYCALVIRDQVIPPTANFEERDPECPLDYVPGDARDHSVKYALSNSFGFGGTNATLIMKKI